MPMTSVLRRRPRRAWGNGVRMSWQVWRKWGPAVISESLEPALRHALQRWRLLAVSYRDRGLLSDVGLLNAACQRSNYCRQCADLPTSV